MTPERARKLAQACADSWYGGASGLSLKEVITQGILEACQETEGDLVATRAERNAYRQDLAAARADATLLRSTLIDIAAVMGMSSLPSYSEWEKIRNKALQLVAALAGEKK